MVEGRIRGEVPAVDVIVSRCAGLDVHKNTVVACVLVTQPDGAARAEVRTFGTMTADLLTLRTDQPYFPPLVAFFDRRRKRLAR